MISWVRALGARSLHVCEGVKTRGFGYQRLRGPWPIAGEVLESGGVSGEDPEAAAGFMGSYWTYTLSVAEPGGPVAALPLLGSQICSSSREAASEKSPQLNQSGTDCESHLWSL